MADFTEVMRQWGRMCKALWGEEKFAKSCDGCEFQSKYDRGEIEYLPCECKPDEMIQYLKDIERVASEWAAEHPEPVYPTWRDYMLRLRLGNLGFDYENDASLLDWNIPADIAEKLDIEPKEGKHETADRT